MRRAGLNFFGHLIFGLAIVISFCFVAPSAQAQSTDAQSAAQAINPLTGPSFPCPQPDDPLAQLICSTPQLALLDMQFVQTYEALYQQVGSSGDQALHDQDVQFGVSVRNQCGIDIAQTPGTSPPPPPAPDGSESCVIVFTPGGPRSRKKIHMTSSSASRNSAIVAPGALATGHEIMDDFVAPPGGRRHRKDVHRIESGETVRFRELSKVVLRQRDEPGPPDSANWISAAGWSNTTGNPITSFTTSWTVPQAPITSGSQLIYLFNGIEPADGKTILQPVLQWGDSGTDEDGQNRTGPFWTVASWLVGGPDNSATHTPHVRVNPGDVLIGVITLVSQSAAGFVYTCEFEGLAGTTLTTPPISELIWCIETLEAYELQGNHTIPYDLNAQSEYPPTQEISFYSINIVTNTVGPNGLWQGQDYVSNYGEHASIPSNASMNGQVVVQFSPSPAGVA